MFRREGGFFWYQGLPDPQVPVVMRARSGFWGDSVVAPRSFYRIFLVLHLYDGPLILAELREK